MAYTAERTWVTGEKVTAAMLNEQIRDNMGAAFPTDAVFKAWTPTYANLTVGNGTITARYIQIAELVVCWFDFLLGSTSAMGTTPTISTPVTASASYAADENAIGEARLLDSGTDNFPGRVRLVSATTMGVDVEDASAAYVKLTGITASVPFTWTTNDRLTLSARFEAA